MKCSKMLHMEWLDASYQVACPERSVLLVVPLHVPENLTSGQHRPLNVSGSKAALALA